MNNEIFSLWYLYIFASMVVSIFTALALEKRLKARLPATQPYGWGFYVGCMGVACGPLAVATGFAMVVAGMNGRWEASGACLAYTGFLALHTVCGWFIIQRKRSAWIVGTVLSCNVPCWVINTIYARKRWQEFGDTGARSDARKSAQSLPAKIGCASSLEPADIPPLLSPQNAERDINTDTESFDARPRQVSGQTRPTRLRSAWRMRNATIGLAVAFTIIVGLAAVWVWQHKGQWQKPKTGGGYVATLAPADAPGQSHFTPADFESATPEDDLKELRARAEKGDPFWQESLGRQYYFGEGVPKDYEEAAKWYVKAANQGHNTAQCRLALCYYWGQGVTQDYSEAVKWYRKAAEQGLVIAQSRLGDCYYNGQGVPKDNAEATKWYRKAAEQGDIDAQILVRFIVASREAPSVAVMVKESISEQSDLIMRK